VDGARVEPFEVSTAVMPPAIDAGEALSSCEGRSSGGVSSMDGARVAPLEVSTAVTPPAIDAGEALSSCEGPSSGGVSSVDGARVEPLEVSTAVALAFLSGVGFRAAAAKVSSVSIPVNGGTGLEDDMMSALPALGDFV
jgi:hypothetical protein